MKILYCQWCGQLLDNGCDCAARAEEDKRLLIEKLEDRQDKSGMYVQQDLIDMYRFER